MEAGLLLLVHPLIDPLADPSVSWRWTHMFVLRLPQPLSPAVALCVARAPLGHSKMEEDEAALGAAGKQSMRPGSDSETTSSQPVGFASAEMVTTSC
mmetsp:Transcript_21966/g.66790  ORF Transcript_21966/g.66790 Transcript_21966/m.66790 type:complete len:97 (-) Transcript_21966:3343-3633(-)